MDKIRIEVAIGRDLLEEAEQRGIDVQAEAERGLRRKLGRPPPNAAKIDEESRESIDWYNEHVERDGLFADRWRRF